jgi:hypothetical protein
MKVGKKNESRNIAGNKYNFNLSFVNRLLFQADVSWNASTAEIPLRNLYWLF